MKNFFDFGWVGFVSLASRLALIIIAIYLISTYRSCETQHTIKTPDTQNIDRADDIVDSVKDSIRYGVSLPSESDVLQDIHDQVYRGVNNPNCPYIICD